MERRAHVAKPFWELFANFQHPDGSFEAHHVTDKFWEKAEADAALAGTELAGHRDRGDGAEKHPQTADPVQHDRLQHRRLQPPRHHARRAR